jgi:YidC/Oxa1 family membrane protein insertase
MFPYSSSPLGRTSHPLPVPPISPAAAMASYARRSLATALSRQFPGRLHPSVSHLLPPDHDRPDKPSTSSSSPVPPQTHPAPLRPSRSQALSLPLPFALHLAAHRSFSTTSPSSLPDIDAAAEVLTDASSPSVPELLSEEVLAAASSVPVPPAPYAGEVAAAAAESFLPVAALQHLLDAVHSFTGFNWYACSCSKLPPPLPSLY